VHLNPMLSSSKSHPGCHQVLAPDDEASSVDRSAILKIRCAAMWSCA